MGNPSKFNFKDITIPKDGLVVNTNRFWLCLNGDPKQALFFGNVPQCNSRKIACDWCLLQTQYKAIKDLKTVFVKIAYIPNINQ